MRYGPPVRRDGRVAVVFGHLAIRGLRGASSGLGGELLAASYCRGVGDSAQSWWSLLWLAGLEAPPPDRFLWGSASVAQTASSARVTVPPAKARRKLGAISLACLLLDRR